MEPSLRNPRSVTDDGAFKFGFLRRVVIAAMGCFFGCLRCKDSQAQFVATQEPVESRDKNPLSNLFVSDEKSSPEEERDKDNDLEDVTTRELKDQAKFLKACGTLPETPLEIRKGLKRWDDITFNNEEQKISNSLIFPDASSEKSKLDELPVESSPPIISIQELNIGTGSLVDSPASCVTEGCDNRRLSTKSLHSDNLRDANCNSVKSSEIASDSFEDFAPNVQFKAKSVRFDCGSDKSPCSLEGSSSSQTASEQSKGSGSENNSGSKQSPYPTPMKLTDDMQTPGTVFPLCINNVRNGKTAMVRSQYVCPVLNPVESLCKWNECNPREDAVSMSMKKVDMEMKDHSGEKEVKDESDSNSWFTPLTYNQEDSSKELSPSSDEKIDHCQSPDRPILGMVAAHWKDNETSHISWWDGNGIPNSTNKYKEDQKVNWHATPFEERLEKALTEDTFIPKWKLVNETPPVDFNGAEESNTPISNFKSSSHFNSAVSC